MRYFIIVNFVILFVAFSSSTPKKASYTAAVVDYIPIVNGNSTSDIVISNIGQYASYMEQAAKKPMVSKRFLFCDVRTVHISDLPLARKYLPTDEKHSDIIVFPQDGLTGWKVDNVDTIRAIAAEVPDPKDLIAPCYDKGKPHSMVIVYISCAAKEHGIYTVVNIIEKEYDKTTKKESYYNTDVVFDRKGVVTAKSRNFNIDDNVPVSKRQLTTFNTDFGAKFGVLSPFDIISANPAVNTLSDVTITDIVYPNSWSSKLPFEAASSVNHGYAVVNQVNLLSAALNDKDVKSGSGIFLANGNEAEILNPEQSGSKLITQEVPLLQLKSYSGLCRKSESEHEPDEIGFNLIDEFHGERQLKKDDLSLYNFKSVNMDQHKILETVCSGENKDFCCTFDIIIDTNSSRSSNYTYMLVAFEGTKDLYGTTIRISNCGILACFNHNVTSCGEMSIEPKTGTKFESIIINSNLTTKGSYTQPSVLNFDLNTYANYTYCQQQVNETLTRHQLKTATPHDSLLTFGIISRSYIMENSANLSLQSAKLLFVFIILSIIF